MYYAKIAVIHSLKPPNLRVIASAGFFFSGVSHLALFNPEFKRINWKKTCLLYTTVGSVVALMSIYIPVGIFVPYALKKILLTAVSTDDKLEMSRAAIFSDNKLGLMLNDEETKTFNLLTEKIRLGSLSLKSQEKGTPVTININRGGFKLHISKSGDGDITCTVTPKIDATLEEVDKFSGKLEDLTTQFEKLLKKQITALLDKFKENKIDPLRLQMLYWAQDKNYMPTGKWSTDMFPNIKFEVNPKIDLSHTGILSSE